MTTNTAAAEIATLASLYSAAAEELSIAINRAFGILHELESGDASEEVRYLLREEHLSAEAAIVSAREKVEKIRRDIRAAEFAPTAELSEHPAVIRAIELAIREAAATCAWSTACAALCSAPRLSDLAIELRRATNELLDAMCNAKAAATGASADLLNVLPQSDYFRAISLVREAVAAHRAADLA